MPCAVDYILEGLAENLELERELGVFALEFNREFLAKLPKERPAPVISTESAAPAACEPIASERYDFVFLHHAAITGSDASKMMADVVAKGIKYAPEKAPVVYEGEKPPAKIYVVLGRQALAKWYEGVTLANGAWFRDVDSDVFYTWSPEDIYRFGSNLSPAMKQRKLDMWKGLQEGMRRVKS